MNSRIMTMKVYLKGLVLVFGLLFANIVYSAPFDLYFASRVAAPDPTFTLPLPPGVSENDTMLVTVTVDNGGNSLINQTWNLADIVRIKYDINNGAFTSIFTPPFTTIHSSAGTMESDIAGTLLTVTPNFDWDATPDGNITEWFFEQGVGQGGGVGLYHYNGGNSFRAAAKDSVTDPLRWGIGFIPSFPPIAPSPSTQTVAPSKTAFDNISSGDLVEFTVQYTASSPRDTTGLGLQLYYDSSKLTFTGISNVFNNGLAGIISENDDTTNGDADASTDKQIPAGWFDIGSNWPGAANAGDIALFKVSFTANADFTADTTINITGNASGLNTFASTPVTIAAAKVNAIPTLSEWGIMLLSLLLASISWLGLGRAKDINNN